MALLAGGGAAVGSEGFGWRGVSLQERANDEEREAYADGRDKDGEFTAQSVDDEEDEDRCGDYLDDAIYTGCEYRARLACVSDLWFSVSDLQLRRALCCVRTEAKI